MVDRKLAPLAPFNEAARSLLDARLADHAPLVDLEDVVERAHEIAPTRIPEAAIEQARRIAPTAGDHAASLSPAHADALARFADDARALLDARLAPRDLAAVVPPRRLGVGRPRWVWAAAAVGFLIAGGAIAGLANLSAEPRDDAVQAEHGAAQPPDIGAATEAAPATTAGFAPAPDLAATPAPDPVPDAPAVTASAPDATASSRSEPPVRAGSDRLAELDALAQAQWKSGDARAAASTFQKIVRLGGRTPYAEQAYGELFALAHQLHGRDEQVKLWRAYLRRFPRGRYADAARSGLCRASDENAKRQCWTRYLDKHPKGAARAEALRETAD